MEAELGGTLETTLTHWADECRDQGGTVVLAHLPNPNGEPAALIATGRVDAVEMIEHHAALVLVLTGLHTRVQSKYADRSYRYVMLEAGHLGHNVTWQQQRWGSVGAASEPSSTTISTTCSE